ALSRVLGIDLRRVRGGSDKVTEHDRELPTLRGSVGRRTSVELHRRRARVNAQRDDGVEQLTAVPNDDDANVLQVLCRQVRQDRGVDGVFAERCLILLEAKHPEPPSYIHGGALSSLTGMIPQANQRV